MKLTKVISRNALSGGRNGRWGITLLISLLTMAAQTAWAGSEQFPIYGGDEGTELKPYQIKSIADLNKLAEDVNSGTGYGDKYFKLINNLSFSYTTKWNSTDAYTSNFTPIGNIDGNNINTFNGHFDGNNKTIRGLRINSTDKYQGLFGAIDGTAVVENVTIADARIAGANYTGGIVGCTHPTALNANSTTVTNCHVSADVAIIASNQFYGGIVGYNNRSTVSNCTSAVKIIVASGTPSYMGGIVGCNASTSTSLLATLNDNFVIGAVIPTGQNNTHAAIAVDDKTNNRYHVHYERNSYYGCTVAGTVNATGKGITTYNSSSTTTGDISDKDGAVHGPYYTLIQAEGITAEATPATTINGTPYYLVGAPVTLSGGLDGAPEEYVYIYTVNGTTIIGNTFNMPAENVSVGKVLNVDDWATEGPDGNSEATAYRIYTPKQLDLLAQRVNDGYYYFGKYFILANDLTYAHTSAWNDATSTENNYTAIGNEAKYFDGTFDGNNKTISGIRIYKGGSNSSSDSFQGLFGHVGGTVKNLTLADARITGFNNVGGIAGYNGMGTITDCHVAADVALHAVQNGAEKFGGIAGYNGYGIVSNCTSGVKISVKSDITSIRYLGGIVGYNIYEDSKGTITGCQAIGASVADRGNAGAIVGIYEVNHASDNPLSGSGNTYHSCLVGTNAFNIGIGDYKGTSGDMSGGASLDNTKFYLDDYMDASTLIAAYADPANHTANSGTAPSVSSLTATLSRTFPAGKKQTICLPFPPTALLSLGTVWEFTGIENGKAVMTERTGDLKANTPYIFEATADVTSLTFSGVGVTSVADPNTADATAGFTFHGTYAEKTWEANDPAVTNGHLYGFMMKDNDGQSAGQFVKARRKTILRPLSCYLEYNGNLTGTQARTATRADEGELPEVIDIVWVSAGDGATGIVTVPTPAPSTTGAESGCAWYDLSGRRLSGEPTAKGVYIKNGKKVAIK